MTPTPATRTPLTVFLAVVTVGLYASLGLVLARPGAFVVRWVDAGIGAAPVSLEDEIEPEVIETLPIDEQEQVLETPCDGTGINASIGIGGGAGGMFGGRRGGRRNLVLGGSAGCTFDVGVYGTPAEYADVDEPPFARPIGVGALSTFSVDVDTASLALVRRFLMAGELPPRGAVRIEEMVNAFLYDDAPPRNGDALAARVDAASCPWEPRHRLVRVTLKGRVLPEEERPPANLVFLLDVSGSMAPEDRLPLVKEAVKMLVERLDARDRVAIVVYAGAEGLALPSTPAGDREPILAALERLEPGGGTNGAAGIDLAYRIAEQNFVRGGINRVILATDGDFNVGLTGRQALVDLVAKKAEGGVYLTALGVGQDNLQDRTLQTLADRGNGNYGHLDSLAEARKILVEEGLANLVVVAKDAKIQVEWNPRMVAGWRLLGYEKRHLVAEEFRDDRKDAGEVGVGHSVTAFYEVVPFGEEVPGAPDDPGFVRSADAAESDALLTARVRWKEPEGEAITEIERTFVEAGIPFEAAPDDFRFGAAVALFGMVLRESPHAGSGNFDLVREMALGALGSDPGGRRAEFVDLVGKAQTLRR